MIIGKGDIASALKDRKDLLFFASGVSNSLEKRETEFNREKRLLLSQDRSKHIIYFGSLCVFYSKSRYARHKKEMEELVRKNFQHYTIIRMGNITWGKNPHTLVNYLRIRVNSGKPVKIQNTFRYLVDKDELLHWLDMIPQWNCEMNITGRRLKVAEIFNKYVRQGKNNDKDT